MLPGAVANRFTFLHYTAQGCRQSFSVETGVENNMYDMFCLFDLILYVIVNKFSVISGRVFPG